MAEMTRRDLVRSAGAGLVLALPTTAVAQEKPTEEEVSPAEDLMREHGLLNRVLLIYEELDRRLAGGTGFNLGTLTEAAGIIQLFIEQYHEKLEEEHLFPRFRKAGKLVELVTTLEQQHRAGRQITAFVLSAENTAGMLPDPSKRKLANPERVRRVRAALRSFIRMYRPHEAREDTVLFPAFRELVSAKEYDALGEQFEEREHQLFGAEGFQGMVDKVAELEKQLGIYELKQFTPSGRG